MTTLVLSPLALALAVLTPLAVAPPVAPAGPSHAQVARWIADLGADEFPTREAAGKSLAEAGLPVLESIRKAAETTTDAEVRRRARDLVTRIEKDNAEKLRQARLALLRKDMAIPEFDRRAVKDPAEKKGTLTASETWKAGSYRVTAALVVPRGVTLTLEPGAVVVFDEGCGVEVKEGGELVSAGTARAPVVLTSSAEAAGRDGFWGRLVLGGVSRVANTQIRRSGGVEVSSLRPVRLNDVGIYATRGDALAVRRTFCEVEGLMINQASGVGVSFRGGSGNLTRVRVSRSSVGLFFDSEGGAQSAPTMKDVVVLDSRGDGLQLRNQALPRITDLTVAGCDNGIDLNGQSYPRLKQVRLAVCRGTGLLVTEGSYPVLDNVEVADCDGVGLDIRGGSYPFVGAFKGARCKAGDRAVAPDSRVQTLAEAAKEGL